jgi:CheY-like chemotaxis protein
LTSKQAQVNFAVSPPFHQRTPLARKILLADDSVTAQNMGRKILTDAGYEVVTVNNGSAALKKIAEGKPDLIVLDVYMPGYSGLEVCQRIKENAQTARIPVLLTVGKLEPFKPEEARRARADAFVVKPFEASELLSALTKLEDKIIPQAEPYKQGRFAKAVASVDAGPDGEKFGDSDAGWKARLRIPTGKPKNSDPDPDYAATQGKGFREYVEPPPTKKSAPPSQPAATPMPERPMPAGLPHDITPEEIAAITAAAAQLSGAAVAPAPVAASTDDTAPPHTEVSSNDAASEEEGAPVTFASSPQIAAEPEPVVSQVPEEVALAVDALQPETVTSDAAALEPIVATESAPAEASTMPAAAEAEALAPDAPALVEEPEPTAEVEATPASLADTPDATSGTPPVEMPCAAIAEPSPASEQNTATHATNVSDDEVMAALQTLIPSVTVQDAAPTTGAAANESATAAFAAVTASANVAHAHAGPRWAAEEVGLEVDEATLSLEREMEAAYAAFATQSTPPAATLSQESERPVDEVVMEASSAPEPPTSEPPGAFAMASAAAAGDGAPIVTVVHTPSPPDNPALDSLEHRHAAPVPESTGNTTVTPAELAHVPTDTLEGDIMAASWKNIRDSIAGAAAKPATLKEEFCDAQPPTGEHDAANDRPASESARLSASDPKAIANIVDSVLAELRPKIVEEIARKLADPKKD